MVPPALLPALGWLRFSVAQGWPAVPRTPSGPRAVGAGALVVPEVGYAPRAPGQRRGWLGCLGPARGAVVLPSELPSAAMQGDGGLGGSRELLRLRLGAGVQDCCEVG